MLAQAEQDVDLLLEEAAHRRRQGLRRPDDRGVGAVGGTERVVDVGVDPVDELSDEGGVVALLAGIEPQVLQELDTGCELGQPRPHCVHGVLGVRLALRPTEVRRAHDVRAALGEPRDRRERGADAEVVGDRPAVHRDVEVGAHEHALGAHVAEVFEAGQRGHRSSAHGRAHEVARATAFLAVRFAGAFFVVRAAFFDSFAA